MATDTTGSSVYGTVPGLRKHIGGGLAVLYVQGDPTDIVNPVQQSSCPSGGAVAYDAEDDQLYQNTTAATWIKLGSVV